MEPTVSARDTAQPSTIEAIYNPNCRLCPLGKNVHNACIASASAPIDKTVDQLFVLQSPTKREDLDGSLAIPVLLAEIVYSVPDFVDVGNIYTRRISWAITYAVKCFSRTGEPSLTEAEACRKYLSQELLTYRPKCVIAFGNTALKSLTGTSGVSKLRGKVLKLRATLQSELKPYSPVVFATWLPSYVEREPARKADLLEDMNRALRYIHNDGRTDDVPYELL